MGYKCLAIINILTAGRLLTEPSHQLIVRELDERVILLCWKNEHLSALCIDHSLRIVFYTYILFI